MQDLDRRLRRTLHRTATHCNTLQHTATHCNTLQHTATHCNTLQHISKPHMATHRSDLYNALQHTATHCNTLQHTATRLVQGAEHNHRLRWRVCTVQRPATHCNTLQQISKPPTATHRAELREIQSAIIRCNGVSVPRHSQKSAHHSIYYIKSL